MSEVLTCQSDYLAADDLRGKVVTVQIAQVGLPPKMPGGGDKPTKSVKIVFSKGSKMWICNTTNQWSMAVLFGDKSPKAWIGKHIRLLQDIDYDVAGKCDCMTVRIQGSPDATPERSEAYRRAWTDGKKRSNGDLCRRLKRTYRLMVPDALPEPEPATTPEPTPEPGTVTT